MLNKRNLMITDMASRKEYYGNENIKGINVTKDATIATNGHGLIKVNRLSYYNNNVEKPYTVPTEKVREIKGAMLPGELVEDSILQPSAISSKFPDTDGVIPKVEDMEYAMSFDPYQLELMLKAIKRLTQGSSKRTLTMYFPKDSNKAIRLETSTPEGQDVLGVLMPVRDTMKVTTFNKKKSEKIPMIDLNDLGNVLGVTVSANNDYLYNKTKSW